jgi:hypothetical protein
MRRWPVNRTGKRSPWRAALSLLLIVSAALLAGCTTEKDRPTLLGGPTPGGGGETQPFVDAEAAPEVPPAVELVRLRNGKVAQRQVGVLFVADWGSDGSATSAASASSVPWPAPLEPSGARVSVLHIQARGLPRSVTVLAYSPPFDPTGEPVGAARYTLDCNRDMLLSTVSSCALSRDDGGYSLPLRGLPLLDEFSLSVNISWAVPPQTGARDSGSVSGTWLFRWLQS